MLTSGVRILFRNIKKRASLPLGLPTSYLVRRNSPRIEMLFYEIYLEGRLVVKINHNKLDIYLNTCQVLFGKLWLGSTKSDLVVKPS